MIGDDLICLITEQSNLSHSQNAQHWKALLKTVSQTNLTTEPFWLLKVPMETLTLSGPMHHLIKETAYKNKYTGKG